MLNRLFAWFWRNRLIDWRGGPETVVKVKGWRTALVDSCGQRKTVTFCGWWGD